MSGPKFEPPQRLTADEIAEMSKEAAAQGVILQDTWTVERNMSIIREQMARYAGDFAMEQTKYQAQSLAEDLVPYGEPQLIGEVLQLAGSYLGAIVFQGGSATDVSNILGFTGFFMYEGAGE